LTYFDLTDRVALVTGASSGLGAHFAKTLAGAGAAVGLMARRAERLTELAEEIAAAGGKAFAVACDVTETEDLEAAMNRIEGALGVVDLLVNNAGMAGAHDFLSAPGEETERVVALNQSAVWNVAQQVCRRLVKAERGGAVINIASIAGLRAVGGAASYAVTKAAVAHMTRIQALELARHGIRVNAIAPGYIATELNRDFLDSEAGQRLQKRIPMRRVGRPEELDGLLLLLASNRSSFMTGAVIPADGGHLLSSL